MRARARRRIRRPAGAHLPSLCADRPPHPWWSFHGRVTVLSGRTYSLTHSRVSGVARLLQGKDEGAPMGPSPARRDGEQLCGGRARPRGGADTPGEDGWNDGAQRGRGSASREGAVGQAQRSVRRRPHAVVVTSENSQALCETTCARRRLGWATRRRRSWNRCGWPRGARRRQRPRRPRRRQRRRWPLTARNIASESDAPARTAGARVVGISLHVR